MAYTDGDYCGFAVALADDSGEKAAKLIIVWVSPARRRCGIGSQLVGHVSNWSSWLGAASLHVRIDRGDERHAQFFQKLGFKPSGVEDPSFDEKTLMKFLVPGLQNGELGPFGTPSPNWERGTTGAT